jgi:hypothetical protein
MRTSPRKAPRTTRAPPRADPSRANVMPAPKSRRAEPRAPSAGNLEIMRSLGIRAQLSVSNPGDPAEIEADRVAEAFLSGSAMPALAARGGASIQRACANCDEPLLLRDAAAQPGATARGTGVSSSITRAMRASQGSTMPALLRSEFAGFFGDNLANVRLHTGAAAESAASQLSANAFARGNDIYFNRDRFAPETSEGRRLLAHELTHVVQGGADTLRRDWPDEAGSDLCFENPRLVESQPWMYRGTGNRSADSLALYGVDLSMLPNFDPVASGLYAMLAGGAVHEIAYPEMLVGEYRAELHRTLLQRLDSDVARCERILLQSSVSESEGAALLDIVQFWSERDDIRADDAQRSYFDSLLSRLSSAQIRVDNLFSSETRSYLDEMYNVLGDQVGVLNALIAQHSIEFGGYRPVWAALASAEGFEMPNRANPEFAARTAQLVMDRLGGATSGTDSRVIADLVTGLTPELQREVLRRVMEGFEGTGEAWQEGMLYWLYEDLGEEDRARVSASLNEGGVFGPDVTAVLEHGRGLGGEYLPYTTHKGEEAAQFWADVAAENEGTAAGYAAWVPGMFSALWLPETSVTTALTLGTAGIAPGIAEAFPAVGRGMLVAGTGMTAYGTTIALQELVGGHDVYSGRTLNDAERVARALEVISGMLMLAAGFMQAGTMARAGTGGSRRLSLSAGEGTLPGGRFGMRVVQVASEEVTVIAQDPATGESVLVRLNMRSGEGTATHMTTGEMLPISGFRLGTPPAGLLGTAEPSVTVVPTGSIPGDAIVSGTGTGAVTPTAPPLVTPMFSPGLVPALTPGVAPTFSLSPPPPPPELLGLPPGAGDLLALPPGAPLPPEIDFGTSLRASLEAELGTSTDTGMVWTVTPDGVAFATPPPGIALYSPDGFLPPGEWLAGRPRVEVLVGPIWEGFSPFDLLSPPAATSRTLGSVRGTRGGNVIRGAAGRDRIAELHGGETEVTLDLPADMTRRADVLAPTSAGTVNAEVKTYLRYLRNSSGVTVVNEVPLSGFIRTEITRDAMIMHYYPSTQSMWVFIDAPPSASLAAALTEAGIPYVVYSDRIPFMP